MSNEQEIIQALEETIVNTENVNQDYKKVLTTTGEVDVTLADGSTTPNLNKRVRTVIGEVPMITDGNVSLEDGGNQREFNTFVKTNGAALPWMPDIEYELYAPVTKSDGTLVQSTVAGNKTNPNVDMTGWVAFNANKASDILDDSRLTQQEVNDGRVQVVASAAELSTSSSASVALTQDTLSIYDKVDGVWRLRDRRVVYSEDYPRLSGELDDTPRLKRMAAAVRRYDKTSSLSGYASVPQTEIVLAAGEYLVSDTIDFPPYVTIMSDGKPSVITHDTSKDIFRFRNTYTNFVRGIRFEGGRHHAYFENKNLDATMIGMQDCEHHSSSDYAIMTHGTKSAEDTHLSALLVIAGAKFMKCRRALYNVCDKAVLESSWLFPHYENFTENSAWITNRTGHLHLINNIGVPVMGGANWGGVPRKNGARWIDNYGSLVCSGTRFGMESDGMVIVHSCGGFGDGNMGSSIIIRDCQTSAGISWVEGVNEIGVIKIMDKCPQQIVVEGNNYQLGCPALIVNDKDALLAYLETQHVNNRTYRKLDIVIRNNMSWLADDVVPDYPAYLAPWINRGTIDPTLSPVRFESVEQQGSVTKYTYPVPLGVPAFTYMLHVSVNPNVGGSSIYRTSQVYLLTMQTGYANGAVSNYLGLIPLPMPASPIGVDVVGTVSVSAVFKQSNSMVTPHIAWGSRDIVVEVSGGTKATVNITPLYGGLYQFGSKAT